MSKRWVIRAAIGAVVIVGAVVGIAIAQRPQYEEGTNVVFFGDSWTEGYSAEPHAKGFAYLVGEQMVWDFTVDGRAGTGYANGGNGGKTFIDRMETVTDTDAQLLILQGGLNDESQPLPAVKRAISDTLEAAKFHYPNARIIVLGPAPSSLPLTDSLRAIDDALKSAASAQGIRYISPIAERWITRGNWANVISVEGLYHPSTAGHEYLASRLARDLKGFR